MGAGSCRIDLIDETEGAPLDRERIQRVVDAALAEEGMTGCALTVLIVDDAESARLHREHFGDPDPTDVMTFPDGSVDPQSGLTLLGDLAVGAEVAVRAAADRGRRATDELTLYVLHGLMHIIGYDDLDPAERQEMWDAQRRILAGVGIELEAEPS